MNAHPSDSHLLEQVLHKLDHLIAAVNRAQRRRDLAENTKRKHVAAVEEFYDGRCPCCWSATVVDKNGERTENAVFDHWTDNPSKNAPHETWLICQKCNSGFNAGRMSRTDYGQEFLIFQKRRGELWDRQMALGLFAGPVPMTPKKAA